MFIDVTTASKVSVDGKAPWISHDAKNLFRLACMVTLLITAILACIPGKIPLGCASGILIGTASVLILEHLYNIAYKAWKTWTAYQDNPRYNSRFVWTRLALFITAVFLVLAPCIVGGAMHFSGYPCPGPLLGGLLLAPAFIWTSLFVYHSRRKDV